MPILLNRPTLQYFNLPKNGGRLLASSLIGYAALTAAQTHAASVQFDFDNGNRIAVDEPNLSSRSVRLVIRASVESGFSQSTCTISGTVDVDPPGTSATAGVDYTQQNRNFSLQIEPPQGEQAANSATQEIVFDILDDNDVEGEEFIRFEISSYGISCGDEVNRSISLGSSYGSIVINDPFDNSEPPNPQTNSAIPVRQKSLSAQLNSLRTLSLHNSVTRDRSIAKEIDRARKSRGFSSDNLQVKLQGQLAPVGALVGGAAGDADFGRWGFFVSGNVDLGEQEKNSPDESDYRTNMLIAGVDYKLTDNVIVGSAVTHSDTDAGSETTANTDFRRYSLSVFGSFYTGDAFYVDAMLTYGSSDYDLDRRVVASSGATDTGYASTDGAELSGSLGSGYTFHHQNMKTRLFSFLNYVDSNIDGYAEAMTGASSAAQVDDIDLQSLIASLGVEFSWNLNTRAGVFTPMISLAQERQYADDSVYVRGQFVGGEDAGTFVFNAPARDDSYLNAQVGLSAVLQNGVSAYATYDTFVDRKDFASGQWSVGARWEF